LTSIGGSGKLVDKFNNDAAGEARTSVATVNFSVPDEVKRVFNDTFAHENKSAVIADLMREAVERRRAAELRARAIDTILARRRLKRPVSTRQVRTVRRAARP